MVLAKGKNYLALRIRQIALENGVPPSLTFALLRG